MFRCPIFPRYLLLGVLLCLPAATLAYNGEFLLFPALTGSHRDRPVMDYSQDEIEPTLDAFYTASHERLRFLAEFTVSPGHNMIERLQIGWLPTASSTVWLGRFHNPLGYWNTEFHHGNYLAATISRPSIIAFEEHGGGVLPVQASGLLLEASTGKQVSYSLAMGVGPRLKMVGLMPTEIFEPTKIHGGLTTSAKLTYRPTPDYPDEFGLFGAYTRIPTEDIYLSMGMGAKVNGITQTLAGAELNQNFGKLHLIGELYFVNNSIGADTGAESHTFTSGYMQADYLIQPKLTLFGRLEDTADANGDPYLDLHPGFIKSRSLAGARYELGRNQAFKIELSHSEHQDKTRVRQIALEWSAVFP